MIDLKTGRPSPGHHEDLRFYVERGIDWEPLVRITEQDFAFEDGFGTVAEAVGFYTDHEKFFKKLGVWMLTTIFGTGIIASRFLGMQFEIAVFAGLAGILVCSLLGGMKAVTWTQVAQYIILIIAYLIPAIVMSFKLTGIPIPQLMYGSALEKIEARARQVPMDIDALAVTLTWLGETSRLNLIAQIVSPSSNCKVGYFNPKCKGVESLILKETPVAG